MIDVYFRNTTNNMNYLAHWMLSENHTEIAIGNFVGDFVKGKNYETYPEKVALGIQLHRLIDSETDKHSSARHSIKFFRPAYGKYAGVVTDIVYDYFLCQNFEMLFNKRLREETLKIYEILRNHKALLPEKLELVVDRMFEHDRLFSYSTTDGLKEALDKMALYTSLPNNGLLAIEALKNNELELNNDFLEVFGHLQKVVERFLNQHFITLSSMEGKR